MKKKTTKFFASPFIMVGLIIMLLFTFAFWIFVLFYPFVNLGRAIDNIPKFINEIGFILILPIFGAVFCPIFGFVATCHKGFSVFEISEEGVKRSLFKVFKKTEIRWDEMSEIRCYGMINLWIFFSKTCLEGMPYNAIIKRKDILQIEYSKKMIDLIKEYTDKEIINLPEKSK